MIALESFELPEHWASYFINGDESGYDESELKHMQQFERGMICVDVAFSDGGDFRRYHDATRLGVLACNVATFIFDKGTPA